MVEKKKMVLFWTDYIVLFVLNAAGMVMELAASRLMSPYFGSSNFVWTAIIGIILLAGSLGNIIGGKIASKNDARLTMGILLLFVSMYLAITPLVDVPLLSNIKQVGMGVQVSAVLSSIIFFLVPATIFGIITPIIMKERIAASEDQGKESGRITAIIAIGSLAGTFVGGFWIIPALGVKMILAMLAFVTLLMVPLFCPITEIKQKRSKIFFIILNVITLLLSICAAIAINVENGSGQISIDTEYGRIIVEEGEYTGEPVRYYKQSGAYSSATFVDNDKKYDLVFDYLKKYDEMFKYGDVKNVLMIGGAAYQYPKYYISHYPDKKMDVVEIDPASTEIAKQYFYLNDLINDYGEERIRLYNEDGRVYLSESQEKYDAVLNDAFSGAEPVGTLATMEAAREIKNSLKKDGVYMSNVLGAVSGERSKFLKAEAKTLQKVFAHVYILPVYEGMAEDVYSNWMLVATDSNKYVPKDVIYPEISDSDIILTDDYCPIDALVTTDYFER